MASALNDLLSLGTIPILRQPNPLTLRQHEYYWTSAKIVIFLTPPTQSLCWRNIGMIPKDLNSKYYFVVGCFYDLKFRVEFLLEFRSHLLLTTRKITSSWYRTTKYETTNTELSMFFVKKKSAFLLKINSYFGIYLYLLIVKQKSKTKSGSLDS